MTTEELSTSRNAYHLQSKEEQSEKLTPEFLQVHDRGIALSDRSSS